MGMTSVKVLTASFLFFLHMQDTCPCGVVKFMMSVQLYVISCQYFLICIILNASKSQMSPSF